MRDYWCLQGRNGYARVRVKLQRAYDIIDKKKEEDNVPKDLFHRL